MDDKNRIKMGVFIPSFAVVLTAAILGLANGKLFAKIMKDLFTLILSNFGWLFQVVSIVALIFAIIVTFSKKYGSIRFGGKDAKAKFSFGKWFAMALTGGIASGIVTWGVNEPVIYFGNIYGELDKLGIKANTTDAAIFAISRAFYNWTFIPYAMYALAGVLVAYLYFNCKRELTVTGTLTPLFGEKITKSWVANLINTLSLLAIALGLAAALGVGLTMLSSGLNYKYGITENAFLWALLAAIITIIFTFASYKGVEKGIQWLADLNSKVFYFILILLFITGPIVYILNMTTMGLGHWFQNFFDWGLDPGNRGGSALVHWWTLYDWAIWIAYAPLMGIFLAMIAYGRTVREFMLVNWILPSVFGIVWFAVWGLTAIYWQKTGSVDLVKQITDTNAVAGMWTFVDNINLLGFKLGDVLIPLLIGTLIISFATAADAMTTSIASLCTKNADVNEEPPNSLKIIWGVLIGTIAFILVAAASGDQGVDGVKFMSAVGGFTVLFIFALQIASAFKVFFFSKINYEPSYEIKKNVNEYYDLEEDDIKVETEDKDLASA